MKLGRISKEGRRSFINYGLVILFFIVITLLSNGGYINRTLSGQLVPICAYVVMALSLNLVVGISGELSLGHAGFMSVGAFSGVIASMSLQNVIASTPLRLAISILIGAVLASIAGLLIGIPVLRLRGDYLAIVTLAFGEIIKNVINILYVGVDKDGLHFGVQNGAALGLEEGGTLIVNGPIGIANAPRISTFLAGIILILIVLFVIQNMVNSRTGRAVMAIRDNRIAAESTGINVTKYKLMAFVTSAAFAGGAGALYAMNFATVVARKFDFNASILILVYVVLGGLGNLRGTMVAAALLTVLPELLRQFDQYRMLVYGIVLVLVMILTNNPTAKAAWAKCLMWLEARLNGFSLKKTKANPEAGGGDDA